MNGGDTIPLQQHVQLVYALFVGAAIASCAYCLVTHQFNGDFFPRPIYLSVLSLLAILLLCLLPYWLTWRAAAILERVPPSRVFEPTRSALLIFLLMGFAAHLAVTRLYGVGVMNSEVYSAPPRIVPFIQVLSRLDPFYLGAFFILATRKQPITDLLAITLMIVISFMRAGLGAFAYVAIAVSIKYRAELTATFKRAPWLVVTAGLTLPAIVSTLYGFRGRLRGDVGYDYSISEMLFGRFVGRLSSYSNVVYIEQYSDSFSWSTKALEPLYYLKQEAVSLLGSSVAPSLTPERVLIAGTANYQGNSSFMAGVVGNLILASDISPWIALLNAALMAGCVGGVLWMSRYLGGNRAKTFGFAMVVYPITSGVANEFSSLLINTAVFLAFCAIFTRRAAAQEFVYGA